MSNTALTNTLSQSDTYLDAIVNSIDDDLSRNWRNRAHTVDAGQHVSNVR